MLHRTTEPETSGLQNPKAGYLRCCEPSLVEEVRRETFEARRLALGRLTAAALVTTGAAAPRTGTRTLATAGSVVALSADGARVAVATAGLAHACDRVVLWNAPARSTARWAAHTNCGGGRQTSGGQRLTEVALAGTRALWVESISGNNQELALWSATPGRKPVDARLRDQRQRRGRGSCGRLSRARPRGRDAGGLQHLEGLPAAVVGH